MILYASPKNQLPKHIQPTNDQKAKAHIIAQEKGITKGQYKRIAIQVTGTYTMLNMTETQALKFIHALKSFRR